jgi:hypothetical protein
VGGVVAGQAGAWGGQAHVDLIGALLSISGEGFAMNRDGTQLALGILLGGRVTRAFGRADLWLDGGVTIWPGRHEVFVGNATDTHDLGGYEVGLGLGIDYFVWP